MVYALLPFVVPHELPFHHVRHYPLSLGVDVYAVAVVLFFQHVEVFDESHAVRLAPGDDLVALLVVFPLLQLTLVGMEIHHERNLCAVRHCLQLVETRVECLTVLMNIHTRQHLLVGVQLLLALVKQWLHVSRVDVSAEHLGDGATVLLVGIARMHAHHRLEVHVVVCVVAAHQQEDALILPKPHAKRRVSSATIRRAKLPPRIQLIYIYYSFAYNTFIHIHHVISHDLC